MAENQDRSPKDEGIVLTHYLALSERIIPRVFRAKPEGGWYEPYCPGGIADLVLNSGRTYLAQRATAGDTVASLMAYMAVGTASAASSLTSPSSSVPGEVARKATAIASANPNNVIQFITTFGGFSDSVTSVQLQEAAITNHASSGEGTVYQRVTFAAVTLANSDLFSMTMETVVGSNTI